MGALIPPVVEKSGTTGSQDKHLLVERIASSDLFQKAPRLRHFFLYAAECTLDNRLADVREPVIAERVFQRSLELQGGQDSIVRAEARNLRKRLDLYFATEGKEEPVVVTMPKGGYSLNFENRAPFLQSASLPRPVPPANDNARIRLYRDLVIVLSLIALGAAGLAWRWHFIEARLAGDLHVQNPELPFSALFGDDVQTTVITSDTGLLQISSLAHRRISLDDYIARSYPQVENLQPPYLIHNLNVWEFTDGREMAIAGQIFRENARFAQHISLRSGHEVQLKDFKDGSVVLIGSPISNPWAQLYEDRLNFHCVLAANERIEFEEKSASTGALTRYPNEEDIRHNRTYARLAFLPKRSDAAPALLIAGSTAQGTEAAGELVLSRKRVAETLLRMGIDPKGPPRFFEILIRSSNFVGGAILPEVVAWRLKPAPLT